MHSILAQLPFRAFITTNYDCLLENALPRGDIRVYSRSFRSLANRIQEQARFILKLHGDIHYIDDLVLAREDYDEILQDKNLLSSLGVLLRSAMPFWIGYGLADPDLQLLLEESKQLGISGGFALVRAANKPLIQRFESARIFPSPIESHDDTEEYLLRLAELIGVRLFFTVVIGVPWPGSARAQVIGQAFVDELSRLTGESCRLIQVSEDSIDLTIEASVRTTRILSDKLQSRDQALVELLDRTDVISFDGVVLSQGRNGNPTAAPTLLNTARRIEDHISQGEVRQMALMSVDIVRHSSLVKAYPAELVKLLLDRFREAVRSVIRGYGGDEINWAGDGGVFAFWDDGLCNRVALAGIRLLHELSVFNLDTVHNPLPVPIKIRAGAAVGLVEFRSPPNTMSADAINRASHLQQRGTSPDELVITAALLNSCEERVKSSFKYKGLFEGEPVYAFSLVRERRPTREALDATTQELEVRIEHLLKLADRSDAGVLTAYSQERFEALSSGVDQVYSILEDLSRSSADIDEHWAQEFFDFLSRVIARGLELESLLWENIEIQFVRGSNAEEHVDLRAILNVAGSRRAAVVPLLKQRKHELLRHTGADQVASSERFLQKIKALLEADDTNQETAFVELLVSHRAELLSYLDEPTQKNIKARMKLAERLWELADLVLIEDQAERRSSEARLSAVLESDPWVGERYKMVRHCLGSRAVPVEEFEIYIRTRLAEWSPESIELFWRCLLVGHTEQSIRGLAGRVAAMSSLWRTVAYVKISVPALFAVATRIVESEDSENMKIFFDCTRSRLATAIDLAASARQLAIVRSLLMIFLTYDFFVQTDYFERIDDLIRRFYDKLEDFGERDDLLSGARAKIEKERERLGKTLASLPKGLTGLPLPIQRWLAQEHRYLKFFLIHPDDRVAREVLAHIGPENVGAVLSQPAINRAVMEWILSQDNLFKRQEPVLRALNHPKCSPRFAQRYLPALARSREPHLQAELERLTRNSGANPTVRNLARQLQSAAAK
jgi:class 3 adenylate cyclase